MPHVVDSIVRRLGAAIAFGGLLALTACGGGEAADAAPTTTAQADSSAGVVSAEQLPSILSTAAGLPSEQDLGQTQSL